MKTVSVTSPDFEAVRGLITLRRSRALQAVNNENLLTAWEVGAFVSARLKTAQWGGKTVTQLAEYLRAQDPTLRGYSRANIYRAPLKTPSQPRNARNFTKSDFYNLFYNNELQVFTFVFFRVFRG